jgi:hypothetical protein
MMKLETGNVLLKPSHRRQMNAWLKRSIRLGQRVGGMDLTLSLQRIGRAYEVRAQVHDFAGDFDCRCRRHDWRNAMRDIALSLTSKLHDQCVQRVI